MARDVCPNCGAEVPRNSKACPGCGSDEKTGWSETAYASGLGLPAKPRGISWFWWAAAVILAGLLLFLFLR